MWGNLELCPALDLRCGQYLPQPTQVDASESSDSPRLIIKARPQTGPVDLEFAATTRQENIEDQLAYLTDDGAIPTADALSLRLLRYHTSAVHHEKFYGADIVTIQVEGSAWFTRAHAATRHDGAAWWDWRDNTMNIRWEVAL